MFQTFGNSFFPPCFVIQKSLFSSPFELFAWITFDTYLKLGAIILPAPPQSLHRKERAEVVYLWHQSHRKQAEKKQSVVSSNIHRFTLQKSSQLWHLRCVTGFKLHQTKSLLHQHVFFFYFRPSGQSTVSSQAAKFRTSSNSSRLLRVKWITLKKSVTGEKENRNTCNITVLHMIPEKEGYITAFRSFQCKKLVYMKAQGTYTKKKTFSQLKPFYTASFLLR